MEHIDLECQVFQSTICCNNDFLNIVPFMKKEKKNISDFYTSSVAVLSVHSK